MTHPLYRVRNNVTFRVRHRHHHTPVWLRVMWRQSLSNSVYKLAEEHAQSLMHDNIGDLPGFSLTELSMNKSKQLLPMHYLFYSHSNYRTRAHLNLVFVRKFTGAVLCVFWHLCILDTRIPERLAKLQSRRGECGAFLMIIIPCILCV